MYDLPNVKSHRTICRTGNSLRFTSFVWTKSVAVEQNEESANNDARRSGAWSRHVMLLTRFPPTDRGRAHCHTDRFTRLFHLRRLRISFTVQQTQTHARTYTCTTYAPFSYSTRAVKRDNINHNANVRNCPFCYSVAQQSGILIR